MMEQADSEKITLKKRFKKTKRFIRYCSLRTLYWLASKLPLSAAKAIGRGLCKIGVFIPSIRKKALAGLAVAFPEKSEAERLQIIRKPAQQGGFVFLQRECPAACLKGTAALRAVEQHFFGRVCCRQMELLPFREADCL